VSQTDISPIVRQLNDVSRQVNAVRDDVSSVSGQVGQVSRDLNVTNAQLGELRARFEEYVDIQVRANAVQKATTEIVDLKAQMDREFGVHQVVRDHTIGTLQALDVGIVTKETVQRVAEELMIATPKYWLAPAIVALAAWVRDDHDLADKAIAESYRRNATKCSLLFTLILARQGRLEPSTRWLRHYFNGLDPRNLPRDFAVLMEGATRNAFGPSGRCEVESKLSEWVTLLRDDATKLAEQIDIWHKEISNQRVCVNKAEFSTLAKVSPTWPQLQAQLESASALGRTRAKYVGIRDTVVQLSMGLRDQMDDLLERLVSDYDEDELPLRRSLVRTQAIIDHDGDVVRAGQEADALQVALDERIDALTMQSYTAIAPDLLGVSISTQQVSVGAAKTEFRQAVTRYTAEYRKNALTAAHITLDGAHSNYASQLNFPGCTVSTAQPQVEAEQVIASTWYHVTQQRAQEAAFKATRLMVPIIIAAVVVIIAFCIHPLAGFLVLLLGGGGVGLYGYNAKQKADTEVARIWDAGKSATEHSVFVFRNAVTEFVDWLVNYEDADAEEAPLLDVIDTWYSAITPEEN